MATKITPSAIEIYALADFQKRLVGIYSSKEILWEQIERLFVSDSAALKFGYLGKRGAQKLVKASCENLDKTLDKTERFVVYDSETPDEKLRVWRKAQDKIVSMKEVRE